MLKVGRMLFEYLLRCAGPHDENARSLNHKREFPLKQSVLNGPLNLNTVAGGVPGYRGLGYTLEVGGSWELPNKLRKLLVKGGGAGHMAPYQDLAFGAGPQLD